MLRENTTAGSKMAALVFTPGGSLLSIVRKTSGGAAVVTTLGTKTLPQWLKIVRSGTAITFQASADGTTWTTVGTTSLTMATDIKAGLAVTSKAPKILNTSTFDNVSITGGTVVTPPPPTTTVLAAVDDAYVKDGAAASTNFGSAGELQVKYSTLADYRRESLLKFSLAGVTTINSAKLRLFGRLSDATAANIQTAIYKAASTTWTEGTVNWSTKPAVSGVAQGTTTITDSTARWYEWDLTALMKAEKAAGRNTVGLILRNLASSNTYTVFNSGEASANQPQLVIT
jgi:endoglucanase